MYSLVKNVIIVSGTRGQFHLMDAILIIRQLSAMGDTVLALKLSSGRMVTLP